MAARGRNRRGMGLLPSLLAVALAACAGLPRIEGLALPKEAAPATPPVYRDLADIPEPPKISAPEENQEAIDSLMADRAKTEQTAEALRRQPFTMPESAMTLDF